MRERYWVYILRCADGSYYTGMTSQLEERFIEHQSGRFPGYTFSRRPVELVFAEEFQDARLAASTERQIKGWTRAKKEALIRRDMDSLHLLAVCKNNSHFTFVSQP